LPADKQFNTVPNQIRLLISRGLQINNFNSAKDHLLDKNYFNLIDGLETLLLDDVKNPPKRYTKKTFDNFLRLYDFDRQLSSLIFQKISEFEIKLKTSVAYHFCKNHCSTLAENNNYIEVAYYNIPRQTDGPQQYVKYFYQKNNSDYTHKLFRKNYTYKGNFKGKFDGVVIYDGSNTTLEGNFTGRFGSTSIREVREGTCAFSNLKQPMLLTSLRSITTVSRINGLTYDKCTKDDYTRIKLY
jgi:abortive infection bacteriophage resistance protein